MRSALEQLLCKCHATLLTLVAGSLGAANPVVVNMEVGSCTHQSSAWVAFSALSVALHGRKP